MNVKAAKSTSEQGHSRVTQILKRFGGPNHGLHDKLIPYGAEELSCLGYEEHQIDRFLKTQKGYMLSDEHRKHYYFHNADDKKNGRYEKSGKPLLGESRPYVTVEAVKRRDEERLELARKVIIRLKRDIVRTQNVVEEFENEINCMKRCQHKHIVEFVESYTDENVLAIVMSPVCEMNLNDYMHVQDSKNSRHALSKFFGCLLNAMCHLFEKRVRHRDVKPENILVQHFNHNEAPQVVICDFGLAHPWEEGEGDQTNSNTNGTRKYKAPELLTEPPNQTHDYRTDVWALACVFVQLHLVASNLSLQDFLNNMEASGPRWTFFAKLQRVLGWVDKAVNRFSDDDRERGFAEKRRELIQLMLREEMNRRQDFANLFERAKKNQYLVGSCCKSSVVPKDLFTRSLLPPDPSKTGHVASEKGKGKQRGTHSVQSIGNDSDESKTVAHEYYTFSRIKYVKLERRLNPPRYKEKKSGQRPPSEWKEVSDGSWWNQNNATLSVRQAPRENINHPWEKVRRLPYCFIKTEKKKDQVTLEWSDYKQEIWGPAEGPAGTTPKTTYTWGHTRDHSNWKITIGFAEEQDAQHFANSILYPKHEQEPIEEITLNNNEKIQVRKTPSSEDTMTDDPYNPIVREIWYICTADRPQTEPHYRWLRTIFVHMDTDIVVLLEPNRSETIAKIVFRNVSEPSYISNCRDTQNRYDEGDVRAAVPELQSDAHIMFPLRERGFCETLNSHMPCKTFLQAFTSWRLLWSSKFESISRKSPTKEHNSADRKFVTVWEDSNHPGHKTMAFRWKTNNKTVEVKWATLHKFEKNKYVKDRRYFRLKGQAYREGNLFSLSKARASGASASKKGETTLKLKMETVEDTGRLDEHLR